MTRWIRSRFWFRCLTDWVDCWFPTWTNCRILAIWRSHPWICRRCAWLSKSSFSEPLCFGQARPACSWLRLSSLVESALAAGNELRCLRSCYWLCRTLWPVSRCLSPDPQHPTCFCKWFRGALSSHYVTLALLALCWSVRCSSWHDPLLASCTDSRFGGVAFQIWSSTCPHICCPFREIVAAPPRWGNLWIGRFLDPSIGCSWWEHRISILLLFRAPRAHGENGRSLSTSYAASSTCLSWPSPEPSAASFPFRFATNWLQMNYS